MKYAISILALSLALTACTKNEPVAPTAETQAAPAPVADAATPGSTTPQAK